MKDADKPSFFRNQESGCVKEELQPTQLTVVSPKESEVVEMLAEESLYKDNRQAKQLVTRLLESGWTVAAAARRVGLRASTVWRWSNEPKVQQAIEAGKMRRRSILGQGLEEAAEVALTALTDVAGDPGVAPKDRVQAAQAILDRCGITPTKAAEGGTAVAVSVDVDFDTRLARIVAAQQTH
jgi:hypothetical protein|tara:strand:- start:475 stop:1020 length:546 start_codon:yes stop_codon:yes gene_type:complete